MLIGFDRAVLLCGEKFSNCRAYTPVNEAPNFTNATQIVVAMDGNTKGFLIRMGDVGIRWQYRNSKPEIKGREFNGNFNNLQMMDPRSGTAFKPNEDKTYLFQSDGGRLKCENLRPSARSFKPSRANQMIFKTSTDKYSLRDCRGTTEQTIGRTSLDESHGTQSGCRARHFFSGRNRYREIN